MSKKQRGVVGNAINSIDIFKNPIYLNMEGERALTSSLGGLLTIVIMLFLGVQAILQIIDMFNHDGPSILLMEEYESDPSQIHLSNTNNFVLAIVATKDGENINLSQNSVLSFTSTYNKYVRHNNGATTKHKYNIHWAPCDKTDFPPEIFEEASFETYGLEDAYCPSSIDFKQGVQCQEGIDKKYPDCIAPAEFTVRGTYLSINFEFIQLKLRVCQQSDSTWVEGLQCASGDLTDAFKTSQFELNLYFANNLINPVDYQVPNKSYIDTVYWNLNPTVSKVADIFIDSETVQNYDSYLWTETYSNKSFYSVKSEKIREVDEFLGENLLEWNVRRSNLNRVTSRTYTKILDVASNIGGMSEVIIIIGAIIAVGYVRYKYQMKLSNELYDFEPVDKKEDKKNDKKGAIELAQGVGALHNANVRKSPKHSTWKSIKKNKVIKGLFNRKKDYETKGTVKDYFDLQQKKKRVLEYSEFKYFKQLICCCLVKKDPEEQLAIKARKQVIKDLDIIKVVEKLKEIDKLKRLLLNHHQREAFNFIEKPVIMLESEDPYYKESFQQEDGGDEEAQIFTGREDYNSLSSYGKLYMSYRHIKDDNDPANVKYNKKLLDFIGEDLIDVFKQVDEVMGDQVDPSRFEEIVRKIIAASSLDGKQTNIVLPPEQK